MTTKVVKVDFSGTLTFEDLCKVDLRLRGLVARVKDHARRTAEEVGYYVTEGQFWYGTIKPMLSAMVGWEATAYRLRNSAAYDRASDYLYDLMPSVCNEPTPAGKRFAEKVGGEWVHFLKDGRINRQARIIDARKSDTEVRLVYFEWFMGAPNNNVWLRANELEGCNFYQDHDLWCSMGDEQEIKDERRRGAEERHRAS